MCNFKLIWVTGKMSTLKENIANNSCIFFIKQLMANICAIVAKIHCMLRSREVFASNFMVAYQYICFELNFPVL